MRACLKNARLFQTPYFCQKENLKTAEQQQQQELQQLLQLLPQLLLLLLLLLPLPAEVTPFGF